MLWLGSGRTGQVATGLKINDERQSGRLNVARRRRLLARPPTAVRPWPSRGHGSWLAGQVATAPGWLDMAGHVATMAGWLAGSGCWLVQAGGWESWNIYTT